MDQQLKVVDSYVPKSHESDTSVENHLTQNGEEGTVSDYELHPEVNSEVSDTTTLEQRRAYKIEMQVKTIYYVSWHVILILLFHHGESVETKLFIKDCCFAFMFNHIFPIILICYAYLCNICWFCVITTLLYSMQKGISLFNRKPSKGIEFLINIQKIGASAEDVALFLKKTNGLNETMIGDYLGEREEFPLKVMHAYVDSFNFKGMDFGEAIRFFLRGFRLPGEAQKIDRIMEKFAERYCKCNPNSFTSADTAYVLAYSVILLNTDAHNSMVKDKVCITSVTNCKIAFSLCVVVELVEHSFLL